MSLLFPLLGHLLVTLARLARRGGVRSVVAEIARRQASAADHETFAAADSQSDLVEPAAAGILHAFGLAQAAT